MKKNISLKHRPTSREHAQKVIPVLLDGFLSFQKQIIDHPLKKNEFHKMRIAGKPLRYMMEIFQNAFNEDFKQCLRDLRSVLDVMGNIHDCDIGIPILHDYIDEVAFYNDRRTHTNDRIPVGNIKNILRELESKRESLFIEVCGILKKWEKERFVKKILRTLR